MQSIRSAATAFSQVGWEHEIIVCDNNSSDRTGELARAQGAHVFFEPVNQISRARNTGAAAADGQWFVFVDADSFPSVELFAEMVAFFLLTSFLGLARTFKDREACAPWYDGRR